MEAGSSVSPPRLPAVARNRLPTRLSSSLLHFTLIASCAVGKSYGWVTLYDPEHAGFLPASPFPPFDIFLRFFYLSLFLSLFPQIVSFRPLPLRKRSLSLSLIYTPERVAFFFFFFHRVSCSERNLRFPVEIFSVGRNICGR